MHESSRQIIREAILAEATKEEQRRRKEIRKKNAWKNAVSAAQASYISDPEYGLTDKDMEKALRIAFEILINQLLGDI